ncbi:hypothetical protein ACQP1V_27445 [Microtetraspora malaysiensis]|uniref:hypothetical protein n=1 Tax=Microtetraspora malaysiensis TaxID=161358 RepID=UPI003D901AF4
MTGPFGIATMPTSKTPSGTSPPTNRASLNWANSIAHTDEAGGWWEATRPSAAVTSSGALGPVELDQANAFHTTLLHLRRAIELLPEDTTDTPSELAARISPPPME